MRQTELKLQFPTEKLDALRFFITKKDLDIEQELKDYLDKTYERLVPANVREYVESRLEQEPAQEQAPEQQAQEVVPEAQQETQLQEPQTQPQRQPRTTRRQREQAASEAANPQQVVQQEQGGEPEEAQGMTMSM